MSSINTGGAIDVHKFRLEEKVPSFSLVLDNIICLDLENARELSNSEVV